MEAFQRLPARDVPNLSQEQLESTCKIELAEPDSPARALRPIVEELSRLRANVINSIIGSVTCWCWTEFVSNCGNVNEVKHLENRQFYGQLFPANLLYFSAYKSIHYVCLLVAIKS